MKAVFRRILPPFLGLAIFFVPLAIMRSFQELEQLEHASHYSKANFEVISGQCFGGEAVYDQKGQYSRTNRTECILHGKVNGTPEDLKSGVSAIDEFPAGSIVPVWYAPDLDAFGIGGQNTRVIWNQGRDPGESARRGLWMWPQFFLIIIVALIGVDRLYAYSAGVPWSSPRRHKLVLAGASAAPYLGFAFVGLGLTLMSVSLPSLDLGGTIVSLVVIVIGLPFCFRPVIIADNSIKTIRQRRVFGPIGFETGETTFDDVKNVVLRGPTRDEAYPSIALTIGTKKQMLLLDANFDGLRKDGTTLATHIGRPFTERLGKTGGSRDQTATVEGFKLASMRKRRRGKFVAMALALVFILTSALVFIPSFRQSMALAALNRDGSPTSIEIQSFALEVLGYNDSDDAILALIFAANTTHAQRDTKLHLAALVALERLAGPEFSNQADIDPINRLKSLNRWAANRLERRLDNNGGVLGWFQVDQRFQQTIEAIASNDLRDAWSEWSSLGLGHGSYDNSRQFLAQIGPALADDRPIHFTIKRGSFLFGETEGSPPFEGQPESIDSNRSMALVTTVGGALALKLWGCNDVLTTEFPKNFQEWWGSYGKIEQLLPPIR